MKLLTATQVARLLRVRVETVYRYVRDRKLPATRVGGRWRFSPTEIEKALHRGNGDRRPRHRADLDPNDDPILKVIGIISDGHLAEDIDHHLYAAYSPSITRRTKRKGSGPCASNRS